MSRTARLRNEIAQFLEANGVSNTSQILEHVNRRFRWGATMNQVGNVLARDRRFEKLGITEGTTMAGFRERVCIWALVAN
ncbi:MAG: DUF3860 domain-containing protein [Candidatus Thermoplasmatota archaeon]|nr:hypothetical protein [Euryarchaeota archaeon]MEE2985662.1 DUF3860 domain-containing protein [Candidatus Thermoplasmatota archaeon]